MVRFCYVAKKKLTNIEPHRMPISQKATAHKVKVLGLLKAILWMSNLEPRDVSEFAEPRP